MINIKKFLYSIFSVMALASAMTPSMHLFAQAKGGGTVAASRKGSAPTKCSGAWTGTVTYKRTQSMTNNKTVDRVSGRGQDTTNFEMNYNYSARVSVMEDPQGGSLGRAKVSHSMVSTEKVHAVEKNSCDRGKTWRDMTGTSTSRTEVAGEATVDANVSIGVNADGTYSVSVGIPQIKGTVSGEQTSSFSGQCTSKEGKNLSTPATPTSIDGNSLISPGTDRINPADPNRISGSYTSTWQNVTETITWSLEKCGAPLRITDIDFADMVFPNWGEWREVDDMTGTIDGNFVRIRAKVMNASGETKYADVVFKETYKGDKWDGARPDAPLKDNTVSVRVEPGEEREVEMLWDTSGFAWYDDGRPRYVQRVKAELLENDKKVDERTENLKIAPKPLILVHGLWSNWRAWETWQNILTTSHSYDWKAFPVGEKPGNGVMNTGGGFMSSDRTNTIAQNAEQVKNYIDYAQRDRNAWHVDIVAHSMGGLISRYYIDRLMPMNYKDGRPQVSKLIMLGTPNAGTPCADVMSTAFALTGSPVTALQELRQDSVAAFNRTIQNRKGVKFSALAGDPMPSMCKTLVWNDGVVSVPSAIHQIGDNARSNSLHTDLTGTSDFSGFVKPRLAVGPKGNHAPEAHVPAQMTGARAMQDAMNMNASHDTASGSGFFPRMYGASYFDAAFAGSPVIRADEPWARAVKVGPNGTTELELPMQAVQNFGITFMASPDVDVTLVDPSGKQAGKNAAGSPESRGLFRSIFVDKNITAGTWKLVITNTSGNDREAILTLWTNAVK
ncbi:MAG: alpha/beta hydrolase [Acidobacteria bacterium]|nr:alpha/beta hydrolase [Acidobacteriota bacterium]